MKISGVIFDLDGTLLDSMGVWENMGSSYLIGKGCVPEKDLDEKFKRMSLFQGAEYCRQRYGVTDSVAQIARDINSRLENFYTNIARPKIGAVDFLQTLKQKNIPLCVATATEEYLAVAALKNNKMIDYFNGVLSCNTLGCGKDGPRIFLEALKLLNSDREQTIVFEDSPFSADTARSAGFPVAGIYDKSWGDYETIKDHCDIYVKDFLHAEAIFD